jgi:hypothetical protein
METAYCTNGQCFMKAEKVEVVKLPHKCLACGSELKTHEDAWRIALGGADLSGLSQFFGKGGKR